MPRHNCPSCQCFTPTAEATLIQWVKQGVKSEGMKYFCEPRCMTCPPLANTGRCPRDPYCKKYIKPAATTAAT